MSKTGRINYRRDTGGSRKAERRIIVRGVRRDQPDLRLLSKAAIKMAMDDAENEAEYRAAFEDRGSLGVPANSISDDKTELIR
jgi:hypothetical protein